IARFRFSAEPVDGADQAVRQQADVEAEVRRVYVHRLFFRGKEVDQQRTQPRLPERAGDETVAGAVPAAAAAGGEQSDATRALGNRQAPFERGAGGLYMNQVLLDLVSGCV